MVKGKLIKNLNKIREENVKLRYDFSTAVTSMHGFFLKRGSILE